MDGGAEARAARGRELALAGDLAGAETEYRAALALAPEVALRLALATVLLDAGRPAEAEPEFRAAWEAGIAAAAPGLALCLRARGATDEMHRLVEAALARDVDDPLVRDILLDLSPTGRGMEEEPIEVTDLRFDYLGERLALRCRRCARTWDEPLPTPMCSLAVGCAGCGAGGRLEPEALVAIAARLDPPLPVPVTDALDGAMVALVGSWHGEAGLAAALTVAGVNVGAAAEHQLAAVVLDAVVAAYRGRL